MGLVNERLVGGVNSVGTGATGRMQNAKCRMQNAKTKGGRAEGGDEYEDHEIDRGARSAATIQT
jgi:hypothetical protein